MARGSGGIKDSQRLHEGMFINDSKKKGFTRCWKAQARLHMGIAFDEMMECTIVDRLAHAVRKTRLSCPDRKKRKN